MSETPQPLDLARFAALAEAYGASLERWPAAQRDAALALALTDGGRAILARARELDLVLDTYRVAAPSAALTGRVLQDADRFAGRRRRVRRWWTGLGLAGVGLAGALAGAVAATAILPRPEADVGLVADAGVWGGGDSIDLEGGRDAL